MVGEKFLYLGRRGSFDDCMAELSTTPMLSPRLHRGDFNTKSRMKDCELLFLGNGAVGSMGYSRTYLGPSLISSATT